ncbi:MAG: hypothetical protein EA339_15455 [Rhodobacteraceae bacterium]|nr:MAG: hypothetical protein EA339_15455 [Paracoccaceae bacterium]
MLSRRSLLLTGGALIAAGGGGWIRHANLNQPVEVASTRPQLQSLLGESDRCPDKVLRFGYAPPMPQSLRRAVTAVIDA